MSKYFNPKHFVRRMPASLLRQYCTDHSILNQFEWGSSEQVDEDAFMQAVIAEPHQDDQSDLVRRVTAHFRTVEALSGRGVTQGLLNEAKFRNDYEAMEAISAQRSHRAKAFWATLYRPKYIPNAKILAEVDALPRGAWHKRKFLPNRGLPIDNATVTNLERALVTFFTNKEWRGENCKIDCIRRDDEEVFFAYAEDHPQMDVFWLDGTLQQQVLSPSFKLIFKFKDHEGSLDIHVEGGKEIVPELQQIFADVVIGEKIPRDPPPDDLVYDLSVLLERGFSFVYAPELGINDVRITKMRFRLFGKPWGRFFVEADTSRDPQALDNLVTRLTSKFEPDELTLDQIWIKVYFARGDGDVRERSPSVCLTAPNSLRGLPSEFMERVTQMLVQSGIEHTSKEAEE